MSQLTISQHLKAPCSIQIDHRDLKVCSSTKKKAAVFAITFFGSLFCGVGAIAAFYLITWKLKKEMLKQYDSQKASLLKINPIHPKPAETDPKPTGTSQPKPPETEPKQHPNTSKRSHTEWNDNDILVSLKDYHFKPTPSDGNCLFHTIAGQLTEEDFLNASCNLLSGGSKSSHLRTLAIANETVFINKIKSKSFSQLSSQDQEWVREFHKDMLQEFSLSFGKTMHLEVREKTKKTKDDEILSYVLEKFDEYAQKTSRIGNWAGTSEIIALARVFGRPVKAYGFNFVESDDVLINPEGKALPYFSYAGEGKPILIFQTGGGGHYIILEPNTND